MLADLLKGKWLGHPLHPALVHLPVGLWTATLVFDLLSQFDLGGNAMVQLSFWSIALGLAAAFLAIPTGLADWSEIKKDKPAWKFGLYHMGLNLMVTVIFAVNLGLRVGNFREVRDVSQGPLILSVIGVALLIPSAYLGGRMVFDYGTGVARMSKRKWRRMAEAGGANVPPEKEKKP